MKSSIGIADSVSYLAVPREPSSSDTRAIVASSGASTMFTKSKWPSVAHWALTLAPSCSISLLTSRMRAGLFLTVWTPSGVSVDSMMKVGMQRFYLIPVLPVGAAALTWRRVWRARGESLPERAPLIVVLGCQAYSFGAGTELRARSHHAAALYHAGVAPRVLASGGYSAGQWSEPEAIRDQLVARGVPAEAIELDHRGTSTRATVATLQAMGATGAVAVSSPYHLPRIAGEARRQGLDLTTSAAPRAGGRQRYLKQTLREVVALWWYALRPPRA